MRRYIIQAVALSCCRRAILTNPDLLASTPWYRLLENDFWGTPLTERGSHGSYRPLCVATFRLNHFLGGLEPWGYHLVNVALHAACTVLVVRVARKVSIIRLYNLPALCGAPPRETRRRPMIRTQNRPNWTTTSFSTAVCPPFICSISRARSFAQQRGLRNSGSWCSVVTLYGY